MQQLGCLEAHSCAGVGAAFNDSIELLLRFACFALHAGAAPDAYQLSAEQQARCVCRYLETTGQADACCR